MLDLTKNELKKIIQSHYPNVSYEDFLINQKENSMIGIIMPEKDKTQEACCDKKDVVLRYLSIANPHPLGIRSLTDDEMKRTPHWTHRTTELPTQQPTEPQHPSLREPQQQTILQVSTRKPTITTQSKSEFELNNRLDKIETTLRKQKKKIKMLAEMYMNLKLNKLAEEVKADILKNRDLAADDKEIKNMFYHMNANRENYSKLKGK